MRFARLALSAIAPLTFVGLTSCNDPVPPTPQGAWYVSFQSPDTNPAQCQVKGHDSLVGSVTASKKDQLLVDGVTDAGPGATVECSVVSVGTKKFDVYAKMLSEDKGLEFKITGITPGATDMSPVPGTASYNSSITANPYTSTPASPCQFYFVPGTPEGVDSGRIWVAFKCPNVLDSGSMSTCQIKQGYAIFENCSQTTDMAM